MTRRKADGTGVKEMWRANEAVPNWERQYGFTQFAMTLNELDEGNVCVCVCVCVTIVVSSAVTCPTDARYRPDQRLLENGDVDAASSEKFRLEEKQRVARRTRESRKERWKPM